MCEADNTYASWFVSLLLRSQSGSLLTYLGTQWKMSLISGPPHPRGRLRGTFRVLVAAWLSPGGCSLWGVNQQRKDPSLTQPSKYTNHCKFFPLSINIFINYMYFKCLSLVLCGLDFLWENVSFLLSLMSFFL